MRNAAFGALATAVSTEASLAIGASYAANQMPEWAHKFNAVENNLAHIPLMITVGIAAPAIARGALALYTTWEGGGNPLDGIAKVGSGNHSLAEAIQSGKMDLIHVAYQKFPKTTETAAGILKPVSEVLGFPQDMAEMAVTFLDEKSGHILTRSWNSLSPYNQDLIKGSGKIAWLFYSSKDLGSLLDISKEVNKAKVAQQRLLANEGVRYGPMNPGPLPERVAKTFRTAAYTEITLSQPTTLYRVYGGASGKLGQYWTEIPPKGPLQARIDLALKPEWGNTATEIVKIRVPAGQTIYRGAAETQGGAQIGGGIQIFIPEVNSKWVVTE